MSKQSIIKRYLFILFCLMFASLLFATSRTEAAVNYTAKYKSFAKKLQKKSDRTLYMAIVKSDQPVLLITDKVYHADWKSSKEWNAVTCDIYQYVKAKKKVVYIGKLSSNGTARPLRKKGKSIQAASNHAAWSFRAKKSKGTVYAVYNAFMESNKSVKPQKGKLTVKKGVWKTVSLKNISNKKANNLYDKYYNYMSGKVICFKRVK